MGKIPKFLMDIESQHPGVLAKTSLSDGKKREAQPNRDKSLEEVFLEVTDHEK